MGEGKFDGLSVYFVGTEDSTVIEEEYVEPTDAEIIEEIPEAQSVQQTVNNPFVFNFTQHGNNNTQIGHVEHYHAGKKED